jgi:hypothetical protein
LASVAAQVPVESQYLPAVHEFSVQLSAHFPPVPHRLLEQGLVFAVVHAPEPLHTDAVVALPSAQLAGLHSTEPFGKIQALPLVPSHCPLQTPSPPQAVRVARGLPFTDLHFPTEPASLQDSHWPSHFPSQQKPSTQKPEVHWPAAEQLTPGALSGRQAPVVSQ